MAITQERNVKDYFYSAVKNRRSYYSINSEQIISDEKLQEVIEQAVLHAPSPMNSQSSRAVLLLGENHNKLWDITTETLRNIVPAENFEPTENKMNSFRNGYGTVLFFEDQEVVESLQQKFELYKDTFPIWSEQTAGMLQYIVWTSLEQEGFGASLQHYNPLIDDEVKSEWNIPNNWKLIGQMPFGKPIEQPGEKQFQPIEKRVKVFK